MNTEEAIEILSDDIVGYAKGHEKYEEAVKTLLTAYEKEKEKNNRYFNQNIEYQKTLEKLQKETIWKDRVREVVQKLDKRIIEKSEINYFANLTIGESLSFKHFLEKELLKEE